MNTIRSVYYGWATLIVAGGGAYYFAKKSINADRAAKAEAEHQKRLAQYQLEAAHFQNKPSPSQPQNPTTPGGTISKAVGKLKGKKDEDKERERVDKNWHEQHDDVGNPSSEASQDPAPTRHAPEDEAQKMKEKSKYEASDVFRSRKGDRFS